MSSSRSFFAETTLTLQKGSAFHLEDTPIQVCVGLLELLPQGTPDRVA